MPYNTRRKSLSLSELGITVPKRSRTQSHPSPPSTVVEGDEPPSKKSKRSHGSASPNGDMSPPRTTAIRIKEEKPKRAMELSPPPSPAREDESKIDTEGISDDIVVGAIQQLERTGNRPHLVKELSAVLATNIQAVERYVSGCARTNARSRANISRRSANPSALISSRLTAYLNRSWPAVSPCPLAKDLSPVHPRRLYFYLTTMPHQPIPAHADPVPKQSRIISPSLSSASAADDEDERYNRARAALSPSPEVDLSSPELDEDDGTAHSPRGSFSARSSMTREHPPTSTNLAHNRRAVSPQLEREERDFKQTANLLHEQARALRRKSAEEDVKMENNDTVAGAEQDNGGIAMSVEVEESEESAAEAAAELFQQAEHLKPILQAMEFSSPLIHGQDGLLGAMHGQGSPAKQGHADQRSDAMALDLSNTAFELPDAFAWDSLQSPENIQLSELDDMFDF